MMTWHAGLNRLIKKRRADPANNTVIDRGEKDVVAMPLVAISAVKLTRKIANTLPNQIQLQSGIIATAVCYQNHQ